MMGLAPSLIPPTLAVCCGLVLACGGDGPTGTTGLAGGSHGGKTSSANHVGGRAGGGTGTAGNGSGVHTGGTTTSAGAGSTTAAAGGGATPVDPANGGQTSMAGAGPTNGGQTSMAGSGPLNGGGSTGTPGSGGAAGATTIPRTTCGDFVPCGGNLVGLFRPRQRCVETVTPSGVATSMAACVDMYWDSGFGVASTVTFREDGQAIAATAAGTTRSVMAYNQECLSAVRGKAVTAETIAGECAGMSVAPTATETGTVTLACEMGDPLCLCVVTSTVDNAQSATMPFTTNGTELTLDGITVDYCVEGNTLKLGSATTGAFTLYER